MKQYIVFDSDKLTPKQLEHKLNWFGRNNYEVFEHGYERGRFIMRHYEPPPPPPRMLLKEEREALGNRIVDWAEEKGIKVSERTITYYLTIESGIALNRLEFPLLQTYIDIIKKRH